MSDQNYRRYLAWRKRLRQQWRNAAEQPVASRLPELVDVAAIRSKLGLSQRAFASRFGFSVGAVRDWEYGRRRPDPAARVLLLVIAHNPDAVDMALGAAVEQDGHARVEKRATDLLEVLCGE